MAMAIRKLRRLIIVCSTQAQAYRLEKDVDHHLAGQDSLIAAMHKTRDKKILNINKLKKDSAPIFGNSFKTPTYLDNTKQRDRRRPWISHWLGSLGAIAKLESASIIWGKGHPFQGLNHDQACTFYNVIGNQRAASEHSIQTNQAIMVE
jgi:hypothetical protein